jgi:AraC family transcriptional regulator
MEGLLVSYGSSDFPQYHINSPATSGRRSDILRHRHLDPLVLGVSVSKLTGTSPLEFTLHPRSDYLLVARTSNRSEVRFDIGRGFRACDMRYGQMLLYPALEQSCWWIQRPEQTVILSIPTHMLRRAWEQDREEPWPGIVEMYSFKQDSQVIETLANLAGEWDRSDQINSAYIDSLLFQLSTHLVRRYSRSIDSVMRHSGMSPSRLNKVLEFVAAGLEEQLGLTAMAQVAGISPHYFCREFKKTMGITPYGYIVQQRIDRAKTLLQNTSMSITEIGAQLLFATPSHFTATFRKLVGCTPSVFRFRSVGCIANNNESNPASSIPWGAQRNSVGIKCGTDKAIKQMAKTRSLPASTGVFDA